MVNWRSNKHRRVGPTEAPSVSSLKAHTRLRLQQGFLSRETDSGVSLHGSSPEPLMSALGHKRTLGLVSLMTALPPKADIAQHGGNVRFVPEADFAPNMKSRRFDRGFAWIGT
jgi:hypothetical protein